MDNFFELLAVIAACIFNLSMIGQWRILEKVKYVEGVSKMQWVGFGVASIILFSFYVHIDQIAMAVVSFFGAVVCFRIVMLVINKTKQMSERELTT